MCVGLETKFTCIHYRQDAEHERDCRAAWAGGQCSATYRLGLVGQQTKRVR